jgi:hypothetical protein
MDCCNVMCLLRLWLASSKRGNVGRVCWWFFRIWAFVTCEAFTKGGSSRYACATINSRWSSTLAATLWKVFILTFVNQISCDLLLFYLCWIKFRHENFGAHLLEVTTYSIQDTSSLMLQFRSCFVFYIFDCLPVLLELLRQFLHSLSSALRHKLIFTFLTAGVWVDFSSNKPVKDRLPQ